MNHRFRILTALIAVVSLNISQAFNDPSSAVAYGADGDVFFHAESKTIDVGLGLTDVETTFDLSVHVEGRADIPASLWGAILKIEPLPGATGAMTFNPALDTGVEPNIEPAMTNPFLDFDRDFGGMAYGAIPDFSEDFNVLSVYVEPETTTAPPTDAFGNLTLPSGAGLAAIPVLVAPGTSGEFMVTINDDPEITGVGYRTFDNGHAIHPSGRHVSATLRVVPEPTSLALTTLGLFAFIAHVRRRRSR